MKYIFTTKGEKHIIHAKSIDAAIKEFEAKDAPIDVKFSYPVIEYADTRYAPLKSMVGKRTTLEAIYTILMRAETADKYADKYTGKVFVDLIFSVDGKQRTLHILSCNVGYDNIDDFIKTVKAASVHYSAPKYWEWTRNPRWTKKDSKTKDNLNINAIKRDIEKAVAEFFRGRDITTAVWVERKKGAIVIEVGAETGYLRLNQLSEYLDKIIVKYDKNAYFEAEDAGLISAYIRG